MQVLLSGSNARRTFFRWPSPLMYLDSVRCVGKRMWFVKLYCNWRRKRDFCICPQLFVLGGRIGGRKSGRVGNSCF
jgi:hypothetical protein